MSKWNDDDIQFPRLLAEIRAVGLTASQAAELCRSMDIGTADLQSLLARAEERWERIKAEVAPSSPGEGKR